MLSYSQIDTISTNIYQKDTKLGIGTSDPNTWLTVVNDTNEIDFAKFTSIAEFRRTYGSSTTRLQIYGYPETDEIPEI